MPALKLPPKHLEQKVWIRITTLECIEMRRPTCSVPGPQPCGNWTWTEHGDPELIA